MMRLFILMLLFTSSTFAQQHFVSKVRVDKNAVFIGEPVEVSIYLYTSTWFTEGVDLGNLKIDGAYTVFFRSIANSENINGKSYAGVQLIYNVFPYEDESLVIPSLKVQVESPNEGDYKGVRGYITTPQKIVQVKSIPNGFSESEWLVADQVRVSDNWSGSIKDVKVGDVLERRIKKEVYGTLGEFILPTIFDSISSVSMYPMRSEEVNSKTKTAISATRTDGMRYLFEQAGEVIIPEQVITWWNPQRKQLYKRTLKSKKIQVQPNPDLAILPTIKSQLNAQQESEQLEEEKGFEKFKIWAYYFGAFLLLLFSGLELIKYIKRKRSAYLGTEAYYFSKIKKRSVKELYYWIDFVGIHPPTMNQFSKQFGDDLLKREVEQIDRDLMNGKPVNINKKVWAKARKRYLNREKKRSNDFDLNP
ncbi:MAG: hypothetical protein ACPGR7_06160 [Flavobacteriaceae bacterium]